MEISKQIQKILNSPEIINFKSTNQLTTQHHIELIGELKRAYIKARKLEEKDEKYI